MDPVHYGSSGTCFGFRSWRWSGPGAVNLAATRIPCIVVRLIRLIHLLECPELGNEA